VREKGNISQEKERGDRGEKDCVGETGRGWLLSGWLPLSCAGKG